MKNSKFEILNSKQIPNFKLQTPTVWDLRFGVCSLFRISDLVFRISVRDLFRISDFGFRISVCLVFSISCLGFFLLPQVVNAGFIVQRPLYIGLTNGLVGYWSFDGPDVANYLGTTTTAFDRSGRNNHGTLINGPKTVIGRIGQALEFDGNNQAVRMDVNSNLNISTQTNAAWIKLATTTSNSTIAKTIYTYNDCCGGGSQLEVLDVELTWLWGGGCCVHTTSGLGLKANVWYHVASTYTDTTSTGNVKLYVDGVLWATLNETLNPIITVDKIAMIGGKEFSDPVNNDFGGLIDDVRVYNRVLTQDEIKRLYKIGATTKINVPRKDTLQSGLVGYWSFDGQDVADYLGTTTTAFDRSGRNNHGTLRNNPKTAIGRIGQAVEFDGVNDYVDAGSGASLNLTGPLSIAAWIYPRSFGTSDGVEAGGVIVDKGDNFATGYQFRVRDHPQSSSSLRYCVTNCGSTADSNSNVVTLNSWQQVVVVADGTTAFFYVNGVSAGSASISNPSDSATDSLRLGLRNGDSLAIFNGLIDDVRVYNRALSQDEIKRLYKIGATTKINVPRKDTLQTGLVGYWTFDGQDMNATQARDASGNANHGTLTNGPVRAIGRIGQAVNFDGVDDLVETTDINAIDGLTTFSFSAWAKQNVTAVNDTIASKWDHTGNQHTFAVQSGNSNASQLDVFIASTLSDNILGRTPVGSWSSGTWHHVAFVYNGSGSTDADKLKVYIDNVLQTLTFPNGSLGSTLTSSTASFRIGDFTNLDRPWNGLLDDVRVYNRVLTSDEIKRLYNMGR